MANTAIRDQNQRTVVVSTFDLLQTLKDNKEKHIKKYEEALRGYKEELLEKMSKAFDKAQRELEKRKTELTNRITNLTDEEVKDQDDYVVIVNQIAIDMEAPKCYSEEYDAAIDMVRWDTRETLELTAAEFNCFVRDKWNWSRTFEISATKYLKR